MSFNLNTASASMNVVANLALSQAQLHKAMERVSSGVRVVNSADDAAGMALHIQLGSEIKGLQAATRNAQDGISILQTADGAMNEIVNLLQRGYQVALNYETGTLSGDAATGAENEMDAIGAAITYIIDNTYWGDSSLTAVDTDWSDKIVATVATSSAAAAFDSGLDTSYSDPSAGSGDGSDDWLSNLGDAIASRTAIGATQAALEGIVASNTVTIANLQASDSRVADADMASEISNVTRLSILGQAGTAMLAQANQQNQNVLTLLR